MDNVEAISKVVCVVTFPIMTHISYPKCSLPDLHSKGQCEPIQIGAFLSLLKAKGETPTEVRGADIIVWVRG